MAGLAMGRANQILTAFAYIFRMAVRQNLLIAFVAALAAYALVAFTPQIFNDGDTYWHIAAGERMLDSRAVLFSDPFSYTFAGQPWNAHEWLSEVLMALAFRAGGWAGVALLFAASFALAAGLLSAQLGRFLAWRERAVAVVLALALMMPSLLARPHLLALPLLVLWTAGLVAARAGKRAPSPWLWPVMTLWANLHGGFLFGFLIAGLLGLEALFAEPDRMRTFRGWAVFGAGALAAASLTPHFVDGLLFPLRLVFITHLANVGEWQPTSFTGLKPFELVLLGGFFLAATRGVKLPASRVLILLVMTHLALGHMRHQIVFAAVVPLILAEPLANAAPERTPRWAYAMAVAALVAITIARLTLPVARGGAAVTPEAALAHVPQSVVHAPVLNEYGFGGYLIFVHVKPFIDSRAELYGDEFLKNYARIIAPEPQALEATLARYGIRWTLLKPDSPAVAVLDMMPGWRRLYADDVAVVHVRADRDVHVRADKDVHVRD